MRSFGTKILYTTACAAVALMVAVPDAIQVTAAIPSDTQDKGQAHSPETMPAIQAWQQAPKSEHAKLRQVIKRISSLAEQVDWRSIENELTDMRSSYEAYPVWSHFHLEMLLHETELRRAWQTDGPDKHAALSQLLSELVLSYKAQREDTPKDIKDWYRHTLLALADTYGIK